MIQRYLYTSTPTRACLIGQHLSRCHQLKRAFTTCAHADLAEKLPAQLDKVATVATTVLTQLNSQTSAVELGNLGHMPERYLRVAAKHFYFNPQSQQPTNSDDFDRTVKSFQQIYQACINTTLGKKKLERFMPGHTADEAVIFSHLIKRIEAGTCIGWSHALVKAAALYPEYTAEELIQHVNHCNDVIYYQFQEILHHKNPFAPTPITKDQTPRRQDVKIAKELAFLADCIELEEHEICWQSEANLDLRLTKHYEQSTETIDQYVDALEQQKRHTFAVLYTYFEHSLAHANFIQYSGAHLYFGCNEKGLYEFTKRAQLHACIEHHIHNLPKFVKSIHLVFYTTSIV